MGKNWTTVQIPEELHGLVKKTVEKSKSYTNPSEFIRDSIRRRLEEIQEEIDEKESIEEALATKAHMKALLDAKLNDGKDAIRKEVIEKINDYLRAVGKL